MAALGWLLNLGFAGGAADVTVAGPYSIAAVEAYTAGAAAAQTYQAGAAEVELYIAGAADAEPKR